jgi:hypothetical protein
VSAAEHDPVQCVGTIGNGLSRPTRSVTAAWPFQHPDRYHPRQRQLVSDSIAGANGHQRHRHREKQSGHALFSWANFSPMASGSTRSSVIACTVSSNGNTGILLTSDVAMNNAVITTTS